MRTKIEMDLVNKNAAGIDIGSLSHWVAVGQTDNLIKEFYKITSVPIILNTSFNENEPIVNNPAEAIDCYIRTNMDILVIGNWVVQR